MVKKDRKELNPELIKQTNKQTNKQKQDKRTTHTQTEKCVKLTKANFASVQKALGICRL